MLIGGFMRELYDELAKRGFLTNRNPAEREKIDYFAGWSPFDAEGLKLVLDEFMQKENVEVRFFTKVIDADVEPDTLFVKGVILSNVEGLRYVRAKAYIDCTGDAVLAEKCGVEFETPKPAMPPTLMATFCGVDLNENKGKFPWGQLDGEREITQKAVDDGYPFTFPDRHIPGIFVGVGNTVVMNAGHVFGMDALNGKSLSDGMATGRRLVQEYFHFYKTHFTEYSDMQLVATGAMMGVRDSRRIKGEYWLDLEDYLSKRKFPDQVCLNAQPIDLHVRDCSKEEYERFTKEFFDMREYYGAGEYFGLPYGILVPKGSQNLWVAGRIVSCDSSVHASIRMMPVCYALGQAAGTAAVQAIKNGETACGLNTEKLVETLRANGAILPQDALSENMTKKPKKNGLAD